MDTISISKSVVPTYLRSGEFYISLSDDEDQQQISVPSNTLKADTTIKNNADLHLLLTSLRFWGVSSILNEVIKYCLSEPESPCDDILHEFAQDLSHVSTLISVLSANKDEKLILAVKSGALEILLCLHERGGVLDSSVQHAALEGGDKSLACVQYLRAQGVEWPDDSLVTALQADSKECFHYALQDGCAWEEGDFDGALCEDKYVEALKYAIQHGYTVSRFSASSAAGCGAIKCLQVLNEANCPWNEDACTEAASNGHLDCLQYLHESGCPWDEYTVYCAALANHIECVQYALQQSCSVSSNSCFIAAKKGHLSMLQYLHEHGCPWNKDACTGAAQAGQLDCLVYLHENGCPWDEETVYWAVNGKHIHCVQYALQQGCPIHTSSCYIAAHKGYLSILQCLHEAGAPWDEHACRAAATNGHLDCLQYAHEHGAPWNERTFSSTLKSGQLECLKYLLKNGCPIDMKEWKEVVKEGECAQQAVEMVGSFYPHILPHSSSSV